MVQIRQGFGPAGDTSLITLAGLLYDAIAVVATIEIMVVVISFVQWLGIQLEKKQGLPPWDPWKKKE